MGRAPEGEQKNAAGPRKTSALFAQIFQLREREKKVDKLKPVRPG